MAVSDTWANLATLNEGLVKLQKSARQTIPMFVIGIIATLTAAGVALFYILTLSADLREARAALQQSQAALREARASLGAVTLSLRQTQTTPASSTDAKAIATAISDVSRSQASISTAARSIRKATESLGTSEASRKPVHAEREPTSKPEPAGTFEVIETGDGFLTLRTEPSMASDEIAKIPVGSTLNCRSARRNASGNLWRPCTDGDGRSGFVSNKFIRRL